MTRDDLFSMAKEAGLPAAWISETGVIQWDQLARFAAIVAAAEREACAELCMSEGNDIYADRYYNEATFVCAAKIRARTTP